MKKILTLFVMLLCGWSIVSAQAPVFGYQAVVRTTDNVLVANTQVDVAIDVVSGSSVLYSETQTGLLTDDLGMLSVLVGQGTISSSTTLTDIDWSKANVIRTKVTVDGTQIELETPVYAVPFALQAATTKLTTEQIVTYLSDPATDIEDYKEIMDSLVNNEESNGLVWPKIKNRFAQYLMDHETKAVAVASSYLAQADANDVEQLYNVLMSKPDVVAAIVALAKQRALANKDLAVEVLEAYLHQLTTAEVNEIKSAILTHETDIIPYVVDFAINNRPLVLGLVRYFFEVADATEVNGALTQFNGSEMKKKLVNDIFFTYLDSYIGSTTISNSQIGSKVRTTMDADYLQKEKCGGTQDVDICDIWEQVEP